MKFVKPIISVLALLVLVKIVFLFPFFHSLEYKASDAMFRFRGVQPVSDSLIIVSIDDETFNALNETWPFPRNYHAKLIYNLTRAGVKQIVFDVEFTENSDPENDRILGESALASNRVIFAGKVINATKLGEPSQMLQPISSIMQHELPWGIVNMNADSDGFIRKYTLFELFDNNPIYSLGIISLAQLQDGQSDKASINLNHPQKLKINSQQIPIIEHNSALINFYGPEGTFRKVSYSSILDDSTTAMPGYFGEELNEYYNILNSGVLKDKIALIGATVDELHDKFPTPYGGDWTSGVEIHANFLEMVKNGNYLTMLNPFLNFLIEFLLALCLWYLFKAKKPQISAFAAIFAIFAVFTASYLSFVYGNIVIHIVQVIILIILIFVASILIHYLQTLKEKRFIRSAFQQYMAPELVAKLLSDPQNLKYGGSLQEVSVLFSDIRSFTTYSESHTPAETVEILREYLTEMVKIIINNQGILDKFVGDEVMAL
ncbi:MAG: adenylate/guanylate cyclase domain-containing protein, partial [Candidatus Cloacimonetes bacterium]|nr:adenylate/guanylate cyclase domain-containing protein [Candidatus Cloacimonadota bacterium]